MLSQGLQAVQSCLIMARPITEPQLVTSTILRSGGTGSATTSNGFRLAVRSLVSQSLLLDTSQRRSVVPRYIITASYEGR